MSVTALQHSIWTGFLIVVMVPRRRRSLIRQANRQNNRSTLIYAINLQRMASKICTKPICL